MVAENVKFVAAFKMSHPRQCAKERAKRHHIPSHVFAHDVGETRMLKKGPSIVDYIVAAVVKAHIVGDCQCKFGSWLF